MRSKFVHAVLFSTLSFLTGALAWAENGPAGVPAGAPQQPGVVGMLVPFAAMFAVVYFLMIRPQQKKMKEQQAMLAALKEGDDVITAAGIIGKITGLAEKVVTVEIAPNVKIKVLRSHIGQVVKGSIKDLV